MKKHKILFLSGLVAISIIYTLYNVWFLDVFYYRNMPLWLRMGNKIIFILIVYGIGFFILKRITVQWMLFTWHIIYFSGMLILAVIAFCQWQFQVSPIGIRNTIHTLMDLLVSPMLYLSMGIIQYRMAMAKE